MVAQLIETTGKTPFVVVGTTVLDEIFFRTTSHK
jgi:hypothetical protein